MFWIVPISNDEKTDKDSFFTNGFGMSIDKNYILEYLAVFLDRYYDPAIQEYDPIYDPEHIWADGTKNEPEERCFDSYGTNRYSYQNMQKMLCDIAETAELLQTDFDDPRMSEIKNGFNWYPYAKKLKAEMTEAELNTLRRSCVPQAVDFYTRFSRRIKAMMKLPGRDIMSLPGYERREKKGGCYESCGLLGKHKIRL